MKHFLRANSYSPPPLDSHGSGGLLSRWLLVMLLAFVPGISWAGVNFYDQSIHSIMHQPTAKEPYWMLSISFYDTNGYDGFFTHDSSESGGKGPAIYIDGKHICNPDYEFAWPGSGSGNSQGLEDQRGSRRWWGNTYTKTIDGVTYTIKFYDPRKDYGRFYVTLYVFMDNWEVDVKHTVKVKGMWRINNTKTEWQENSWTINAIPNPFKESSLKSTFTNYNTAELTGDLNTSLGLDNHVAIAKDYPGPEGAKRFIDERKFTGWQNFPKGTAKISNMPYNVSDYYAEHDRKFYVQHYMPVSPASDGYVYTYVWSGSEVTVIDPIWPVNIKAEPDMCV